ncbi:MAG TPA: putative transporter [Bacteroidales bacterium]|nr:putative transporter [Bacteroidales bacterium]HPT02160.1 putative transporter [Bacteroidales bacterium]
MEWIRDLLMNESVAQTVIIYSFVIAVGVALGKVKIYNISLGITFVLFAGIAIGHFGFRVNHEVLDFAKDFGLILFVFAVGLQVGPGFFSSFRKGGLTLNLLAVMIVLLGGVTVVILQYITGISMPVMVGIMSGAVTNTPGLGAAQDAYKEAASGMQGSEMADIGLGYAVAYPFGVLGIILTMMLIRRATGTDMAEEIVQYERLQHPEENLPKSVCITITNPSVTGKKIRELKPLLHNDAVISRVLHEGEMSVAHSGSLLCEGDVILLVAENGDIPGLIQNFGKESDMDLSAQPGKLMSKQVLVTCSSVNGKSLESLNIRSRFDVNITRVYRAGIELVASPKFRLQIGDKITVVGDENAIEGVARLLGNSLRRLNEPNLFPIFIGILLGVLLGSIPVAIGNMPTPVKLGLAGGPLIVAILLSKFGYKLSLTSYTTPSANLMLREIGIVLFLASVGIKAGEKFIPTLVSGDGFLWMGYGSIITLAPIILAGLFTKIVLKWNFFEVCGLLAGSMTDPPALAFANSIAQSEAPAVAYATVYPLVMFLRIVIAQLLVMLFV